MVHFFNGKPDKSNYRRFKIKTVKGQDDYAMMAEIVSRRYSRLLKEKKKMPDLIIIDGGKGQLHAAFQELQKLELHIPIIGLAKKLEEIYFVGAHSPLRLPFKSEAHKLLRRIRDEAHRFGIKYHRLLRSKGMLK
jgi:excinuclease ABC subunit C